MSWCVLTQRVNIRDTQRLQFLPAFLTEISGFPLVLTLQEPDDRSSMCWKLGKKGSCYR